MSGIESRGQRVKLVGYQCARYNVHNKLFKSDSARVAFLLCVGFSG